MRRQCRELGMPLIWFRRDITTTDLLKQ
jgi:hypothetical protein